MNQRKTSERIRLVLFNTEMVKALLEGRKTVTRRVMKPQPQESETNPHRLTSGCYYFDVPSKRFPGDLDRIVGPYWPPYQPGDILWVRESWQVVYETEWSEANPYTGRNIRELIPNFDSIQKVEAGISQECSSMAMKPRMKYFVFKASDIKYADNKNGLVWRPSIHMPREAARIFLRVKGVGVERLQDIDDAGVTAEGLEIGCYFDELWDSTIKPKDRAAYGWGANPWVWVIQFEHYEKPSGFGEGWK